MHKILETYAEILNTLNLSENWHISNENLEYEAISEGMRKFFAPFDLLHKRFFSVPHRFQDASQHIFEIVSKFKNSCQISAKYLALLIFDNYVVMLEMRLTKIFEPLTDKLIGIIYFFNNIPQHSYITEELYLKQKVTIIPLLEQPYTYKQSGIYSTFNSREQIVLWLLAVGRSHRDIAEIISKIEKTNVSSNTITTTIHRNIYTTLGISNNSELLIKLNQEDGLSSIPKPLFDYYTLTEAHND